MVRIADFSTVGVDFAPSIIGTHSGTTKVACSTIVCLEHRFLTTNTGPNKNQWNAYNGAVISVA